MSAAGGIKVEFVVRDLGKMVLKSVYNTEKLLKYKHINSHSLPYKAITMPFKEHLDIIWRNQVLKILPPSVNLFLFVLIPKHLEPPPCNLRLKSFLPPNGIDIRK